ncbi:MAG: DUF4870 family protein [Gammaproteobacteria bacterium]
MSNNTPVANQDELEDPITRKVAYGIYIAYLASIVLPMLPIIGVIFAYVFENDGRAILKSHYDYLIRSFWLGILYFGISGLLVLVLIGFALLPICVIWWLIRMAKGLKSLMRNQPIANPKTWLF